MTNTPKEGAFSDEELARQQGAAFARVLRELTPRVYVTPVLVAANVVVFVLMVASGVHVMNPTSPDLLKWGADHGPNVLRGEWWRTFTCMFVHIGVIHLAMNMFILAAVGPLVERLVGNVGFLVLYLVAGLGGSLLSLCYHPLAVSAGASGAVFGLYGALLAVLRQKPGEVPAEVLDRIRKSGLTFVGYNLVFGLMMSGIDNAAHVGGLVTGFLCGFLLNMPLATESRAKRPARVILTVLLGLVLVTAGAVAVNALAGDVGDAIGELERFEAMEKRALEAYNTALGRVERGELTESGLADVLERDVLPDWRASVQKLGAIKNAPPPVRTAITGLVEYARLRQEGWELAVQAIREHDPEKMRRAHAKQDEAELAAKKINPPGK